MNQFHEEFVAEAWLFCVSFGLLFAWLMARHLAWPALARFRLRAVAVAPALGTPAPRTFSFRAECPADADELRMRLAQRGLVTRWQAQQLLIDGDVYPGLAVEFDTHAVDDEVRLELRAMVDGHVMLQTLRPVPLSANGLERDFDAA